MSNENPPGCLGYIGDYTTQLRGDYCIINSCKDPYWTTSIMESKRVFFVAHMSTWETPTLRETHLPLNEMGTAGETAATFCCGPKKSGKYFCSRSWKAHVHVSHTLLASYLSYRLESSHDTFLSLISSTTWRIIPFFKPSRPNHLHWKTHEN